MIRKIIKIDENKCNGCGLCVTACHEGAISMVNGKATLIRDDYCDGLGNCLPVCPTEAITFQEREAAAFDEEAVKAHVENASKKETACGCPSSNLKTIESYDLPNAKQSAYAETHLNQWPVQIKLVPPNAPYFNNADLLVAADCTAFSYGNFHEEFMKNKITIIGCPKLDEGDYSEKLTAILKMNDVNSVTVARMEVPCCGGIEYAAKTALKNSRKEIAFNVVTISTDGKIL